MEFFFFFFFFQAEDGIRDHCVTGVQTCALPISTKPRLVGAAGLTGPTLTVNGATVSDLRIESSSSYPALEVTGTAERVELYASAGNGLTLHDGSTLTNSVVHTSAANASAVRITSGLLSATTVSHSTIVATGASSTALDASGLSLL